MVENHVSILKSDSGVQQGIQEVQYRGLAGRSSALVRDGIDDEERG